jgi:hypothetical protein
VLLILVWMESDHMRYLAVAEPLKTLPSLGVPEFHLAIISTREELPTIVGKRHIFHILGVTMEGTQTVAVRINIPELG